MTTQTTIQDNLKPVDFDIGRISYALMVKDFPYWQYGYEPPRPLGVVKHEVARQVATFAAPALMLLAAGLLWGANVLLLALAPALFAGWLNDLWLQSSIARQRAAEEVVDLGRRAEPGSSFALLDEEPKGRYALMRELAYRLKVPVKAVTPNLVRDFAMRYMSQSEQVLAAYAKQQQEAAAERSEQQRVDAWFMAEMAKHRAAEKAVAIAAATGLAVEEVTEEVVTRYDREQRAAEEEAFASTHPELLDLDLGVNVASGLPMISGTPYDAGGNVYGTTSTFD